MQVSTIWSKSRRNQDLRNTELKGNYGLVLVVNIVDNAGVVDERADIDSY